MFLALSSLRPENMSFLSPEKYFHFCVYAGASAYARGGLGFKPPFELDILQKLYYLRKGD